MTSISYELEPAIWSRYHGQRTPCFDRCLLTTTWKSNVKDICCKPGLGIIEVLHGSHVAWQEQKIPFPMGKEVLSNAKYFHCSCHATWLPCKTSISAFINSLLGIMRRRRRRRVERTRPRSMPLAMLTMKKELHGFLFLCMHVVLFLLLWCSAGGPKGPPAYNYRVIYARGRHERSARVARGDSRVRL